MYFTVQLKKSSGALTFIQIIFAFTLLVVLVKQVSAVPVPDSIRKDLKERVFERDVPTPTTFPILDRRAFKGDFPKPTRSPLLNERGHFADGFKPKKAP